MAKYKTQSERMKENWKNPEWRKMMAGIVSKSNRKSRKGIPRTEETKKKISEAIKKKHAEMTDEEKEQRNKNISKSVKKAYEDSDLRKKLSKSNKEAYIKDPTLKDRVKQSVKETYDNDPTLREKASENAKNRWKNNPELKKKQSEKLKAYFQTPEGKEARKKIALNTSKHHKGRKNTPEHNQKISDTISNMIVEGKGYFGYYKYSKRGHHNSPKAGKVYYRSAFELLAYKILDEDDTVSTYQTEPIRIPYVDDKGSKRFYIPDLKVCYKDGSEKVIEVRPKDMVELDKIKFDAARLKLGESYQIWTEEDLGLTNSWDAYPII